MSDVLGRQMFFHAVTLKGRLSLEQWRALLREITATINMKSAGEPAVFSYPVDGCGGNGHTVVQPITESFIALDTWPDHDGAYFLICSCQKFNFSTLHPLFRNAGLTIGAECAHTMRIE